MNDSAKPWWASKTIWSALAILIIAVTGALGGTTQEGDAAVLGEAMGAIATGVFALIAIWGRVSATRRIGSGDGDAG